MSSKMLKITEKKTSKDPKDFANLVPDLPKWQPHVDPTKEYENFTEQRIWRPVSESDDECRMPELLKAGRAALTTNQISRKAAITTEHCMSETDALENSCSDYAMEHILRTFHDSGGVLDMAFNRLTGGEMPKKLTDRWSTRDVVTFGEGLGVYSKNFDAIRANLLPHKTPRDIVEFYYAWKRSNKAYKGSVACRARRFLKGPQKSENRVIASPPSHTNGTLTRNRLKEASREQKIARSPTEGKRLKPRDAKNIQTIETEGKNSASL